MLSDLLRKAIDDGHAPILDAIHHLEEETHMAKEILANGNPFSGEVLPPLPTKLELKALWNRLMDMPDTKDDLLPEDLAHFTKGTRLSEVFDWFKASHAVLDAREPSLVVVRFQSRLGARQVEIPGRDVHLSYDGFFVDGVAIPKLAGRTILDIRAKGAVYNEGGFKIYGLVNGVWTQMDRREKPAAEVDPEPTRFPRR